MTSRTSVKSYYSGRFATDLAKMVVRNFPNSAGYITFVELQDPQRGVLALPPRTRAHFIVCLFFTVLVDQAMHAYGPRGGIDFKSLAKYPQWGILGGANSNPWGIIATAINNKLVSEVEIESIAEDAMQLFADEVMDFFRQYLEGRSAIEFLENIRNDPDVRDGVFLRAGLAGMAMLAGIDKAIKQTKG